MQHQEPPKAEISDQDRIVVPEYEETIIPHVRDVEYGSVVINKRVETVPYNTTIDLEQDEVTVERVPINQPVDEAPRPRYEGDVLVVPVVEEVLETRKRLVLREEVRITRRRVSEPATISDTVRREIVEIEQRGEVAFAEDEPSPPTGT